MYMLFILSKAHDDYERLIKGCSALVVYPPSNPDLDPSAHRSDPRLVVAAADCTSFCERTGPFWEFAALFGPA
jgi:hypothetical protein